MIGSFALSRRKHRRHRGNLREPIKLPSSTKELDELGVQYGTNDVNDERRLQSELGERNRGFSIGCTA